VCGPKAAQYLGQPVDPTGRYNVSGLTPTKSYWKRGRHTVACGITGQQYLANEPKSLVGRVNPDEQAALAPLGPVSR